MEKMTPPPPTPPPGGTEMEPLGFFFKLPWGLHAFSVSGLLVILIALCLQALLSVISNAHHTLLVSKQLQLI